MLPHRKTILRRAPLGAGILAGAIGCSAAAVDRQQTLLVARSVLPAVTFRAGSPPSGAFLTTDERATAGGNGVSGPASGPYLPGQPIQGFSSMVPADAGTWWALADNGAGARGNSADFQLVIHRVDPRWNDPRGPQVLDSIVLHDPDRRIPWTVVCDPGNGSPLPDFSFNVLSVPPPSCGAAPAGRILTGFDLDPESFVRAPDGTFWIGDEFGPFLVHAAPDGRVLEAPIGVPRVRSPQNPFLNIADRTRAEPPTLAASRGFEGLAISPDGTRLYALLEGAVTGDDPQDLRIYVYDIAKRAFAGAFLKVRLEMPSQQVNLASLNDASGARVYPDAAAPAPGPVSIGELKAVNDRHLLMIERDNHGDDLDAPRFKKVFLLDLSQAPRQDGYLGKALLVDLLAIPDPSKIGGDGDFFQLPFYTIESVHVVDARTLLVATDNNFPFSNGRARSRSKNRSAPLTADDTEIVLVRLGVPLDVDRRLLPGPR
jgi:hypothetical protein